MKIKKSTIILIIILLSYTILSFYKLGRNENPQTFVDLKNGEYVTYKLPENTSPDEIMLYTGNNQAYISIFLVEQSKDEFTYNSSFSSEYPFKWNKISLYNVHENCSYIAIQSYSDETVLGELKIYDKNKSEVIVTPIEENAKLLIDEQETVPQEYSYMNSSYFDEVYFPRASYEILNNLPIYEFVHPPLGKLIISIPMSILGTTPFAYRLMGNIAGILMILIIYLIAKELFKKERYGLFASSIMALDGMHFVQTRIGTVDTFLVLFSLISFLFFIKYIKLKKEESFKKKVIALLLSGIFWGMAISVKWTASFIGLGMGIIYAVDFIINKKWNAKLILWSILSFVIIPITIYLLSYIPVINNPNEGITDIKSFFEYQKKIYDYHSQLKAEHPFTSQWYTWPIMQKPMWYYTATFENGKYSTISCMGNPIIWWLSVITFIFTLIYSVVKKNKEGLMILVMVLTTWLPYMFIGRIMFIYHYFITLPFMMLTIVFAIHKIVEWKEKLKYSIPILTTIFLIFFIYFYPIYSGKPVDKKYIENTQWFKTWIY